MRVSGPLTRLVSHCALTSPMLCSLFGNGIGDKGASALAAVLKETQITNLEYASTSNRRLSVRFCVSAH